MSCCDLETFMEDYLDARKQWFDAPPTRHALGWAKRDWKSGNTGWEAAHNEQRRAKHRVERADSEPFLHTVDEES